MKHTDEVGAPSSSRDNPIHSETLAIDEDLRELRSRISDLGHEIDARKGTIARSMGGAVFLLMLAAGAAYDLMTRNVTLLISLGIARDTLTRVAYGCGVAGVALLVHALMRLRLDDHARLAELAKLEQEYSTLLDHKDAASQAEPSLH